MIWVWSKHEESNGLWGWVSLGVRWGLWLTEVCPWSFLGSIWGCAFLDDGLDQAYYMFHGQIYLRTWNFILELRICVPEKSGLAISTSFFATAIMNRERVRFGMCIAELKFWAFSCTGKFECKEAEQKQSIKMWGCQSRVSCVSPIFHSQLHLIFLCFSLSLSSPLLIIYIYAWELVGCQTSSCLRVSWLSTFFPPFF